MNSKVFFFQLFFIDIEAEFTNGVLHLKVVKKDPPADQAAKKINITRKWFRKKLNKTKNEWMNIEINEHSCFN